MTHVIGDAAFVGDTLFMPDGGRRPSDTSPQVVANSCGTSTRLRAGAAG